MIDPVLVRERLPEVEHRLRSRGSGFDEPLARLQTLDAERRRLIPAVENLKRERNESGEMIARAKRAGMDASELLDANRGRGDAIKELEADLERIERERHELLLTIPNLPHESVPIGSSSADNVEVRRSGTPPAFDFSARPHWEIGSALGILDFERAAAMSGARFSVLAADGARLERALVNFMLNLHVRERGYTEIQPPYLVRAAALVGTGNLPKFEADLFRVAGEWDLFLIPTAEVPLVNLHRDEILDGRHLPLRYVAYTPCFRSEAGSHGADVRGLIRQHQFDKVELVSFTTPEASYDEHERLTSDAEEVLRRLDLPFRTVTLSTGDMGFAAAKTYDIEVWLPGQNGYREISSCSNTEAFQARRANIKFRPDGTGKAEFVHTLNGSGLAVGRTLIAVLENYQQKDGSVVIPPVLRPYMNGQERIAAR
jgi:seryl-tRNA synthetase